MLDNTLGMLWLKRRSDSWHWHGVNTLEIDPINQYICPIAFYYFYISVIILVYLLISYCFFCRLKMEEFKHTYLRLCKDHRLEPQDCVVNLLKRYCTIIFTMTWVIEINIWNSIVWKAKMFSYLILIHVNLHWSKEICSLERNQKLLTRDQRTTSNFAGCFKNPSLLFEIDIITL